MKGLMRFGFDVCIATVVMVRWLPTRLALTTWRCARAAGASGIERRADRAVSRQLADRPRERARRARMATLKQMAASPPLPPAPANRLNDMRGAP
jgi:hypothetical protein